MVNTARQITPENTLNILAVDDSAQAREYLMMTLQARTPQGIAINLHCADSGEEAIQKCRENKYDLIFLDVEMPGLNGFSACQELRKLTDARIAMVTSKALAEDFRAGSKAGCNHYLIKPPNPSDISAILSLTSLKKQL